MMAGPISARKLVGPVAVSALRDYAMPRVQEKGAVCAECIGLHFFMVHERKIDGYMNMKFRMEWRVSQQFLYKKWSKTNLHIFNVMIQMENSSEKQEGKKL